MGRARSGSRTAAPTASDAAPARTPVERPPVTRPSRVVVTAVNPQVEGGRHAVKRVVGEGLRVEADVFVDGHDIVTANLMMRSEDSRRWTEYPMAALGNDRFEGRAPTERQGRYRYTVRGWVDRFASWHEATRRKAAAGQDVSVDIEIGAALVDRAADASAGVAATSLRTWAGSLRAEGAALLDSLSELSSLMRACAAPEDERTYPVEFPVVVDRERARFSTWYEFFPRSVGAPGKHGTLADAAAHLSYVAAMGFDVVYLPPIHPIGTTLRKGRNNATRANPDDPGSPWAIGGPDGGHDAVHPALGTPDDVRRLVAAAHEHGLEIALDLALQCSPDHPWVREHPEWFRHRPDGSVQYAENPPKRYEDIYPLHFESQSWSSLWEAIFGVVLGWVELGVRVFRVDNPHTKPFAFWEWLIAQVKAVHPDVLFLAEAFTRPKVMHQLARLGFTQSYTYFTWRNTAWELRQYFTDLTATDLVEYFRPNAWPNTPDILSEYLQTGARAAFNVRLVLAATLCASYGVYGPAFETAEATPREPGSEEYLNSEKYELRSLPEKQPPLVPLVTLVNQIRREHPALQSDRSLRFHDCDTPELLAYSKQAGDDAVLTVVNVDPHHRHSGWVRLRLDQLGIEPGSRFQLHDLLSGARYLGEGDRLYVELDPAGMPAHIFAIRRRVRTERDFDYWL